MPHSISRAARDLRHARRGPWPGAVVSLFTVPSAAILAGWDVARRYLPALGLDRGVAAGLRHYRPAGRSGRIPAPPVADLVVVGAGTALLVAVGFALVKAGQATGGMKSFLVTLGLLSVRAVPGRWCTRCTRCATARAYYSSEPAGGIEFNESEPPTLLGLRLLRLHRRDDVPGGGHQHHLEGSPADKPSATRCCPNLFRRGSARARDQRGGHPAEVTAARPRAYRRIAAGSDQPERVRSGVLPVRLLAQPPPGRPRPRPPRRRD